MVAVTEAADDVADELRLARRTEARLRAVVQTREAELALREVSPVERAARERESAALREQLRLADEELAAARRELGRAGEGLHGTRLALPHPHDDADARHRVDAYRARIRELEQLVSTLANGLAATRDDVERAERSRAWRWGHGATTLLTRLARRPIRTSGALHRALVRIDGIQEQTRALPDAKHQPSGPAPSLERQVPISPSDLARLAELGGLVRSRLGPAPSRADWPAVSVIVVAHNGRSRVASLATALRAVTEYPSLELVVVDNGSSDGTATLADGLAAPGVVVRYVRSDRNLSFAAANDLGMTAASHERLLLLNDDVVPIEDGWLKELVHDLDESDVAAVGATLVRPEFTSAADVRLQHVGIHFGLEQGRVRAFNTGDGDRLFDRGFGSRKEVPAATGACLLVTRTALDAAGGLTQAFRFGLEDVDLGLRLRAAGKRVIVSGRAVLAHAEGSTQRALGGDTRSVNRDVNRRVLLERWGPRLMREYRMARLAGDTAWTDGAGLHAAVTTTSHDPADGWGDWYTAHELGAALESVGWRVTYVTPVDPPNAIPGDLDVLISLLDGFDVSRLHPNVLVVAWIRNWTDRWLDRRWFARTDLVLASSTASVDRVAERTGRTATLFPLATNPDRFAMPLSGVRRGAVYTGNRWGEARAIEDAAQALGAHGLTIYGRGWESIPATRQLAAGEVAYEDLPAVYGRAAFVVDDTQTPTAPWGSVNARVFDGLAAGALVVTDCAEGVRALFGETYPTWSSAEDLGRVLEDLGAAEDERAALVERFRTEVLGHHTYGHRARSLTELVTKVVQRPTFAFKIGAPDSQQADRWGDLHFAQGMARELTRLGHRCRVQPRDEWDDLDGAVDDVVVHLRGLGAYHPKPGQLNVLWVISHPAEVDAAECDAYDLVCVASERFARRLAASTRTPVVVLEQATDPGRFYPDPDAGLQQELAYVANSRGVLRSTLRDLLPTHRDLGVWGASWEGLIDPALVRADHVPNDRLRRVYSSAGVVLADHWDDMREHGFVSNRIYDALACGAAVVSDAVPGLDGFGGSVTTYETPDELAASIDALLASPARRREVGDRGRAWVLEHGTFERRARELLDVLDGLRASTGSRLRVLAGTDAR